MRKLALALAAVAAASMTAPADASIVYTAPGTAVGSTGSYTLSITTDGTIGAIQPVNITDFSILISDSHGSITLTPGNAQVGSAGVNLTASSSALTFDFSGFGYVAFQNPNLGSGQNFICFAA